VAQAAQQQVVGQRGEADRLHFEHLLPRAARVTVSDVMALQFMGNQRQIIERQGRATASKRCARWGGYFQHNHSPATTWKAMKRRVIQKKQGFAAGCRS